MPYLISAYVIMHTIMTKEMHEKIPGAIAQKNQRSGYCLVPTLSSNSYPHSGHNGFLRPRRLYPQCAQAISRFSTNSRSSSSSVRETFDVPGIPSWSSKLSSMHWLMIVCLLAVSIPRDHFKLRMLLSVIRISFRELSTVLYHRDLSSVRHHPHSGQPGVTNLWRS